MDNLTDYILWMRDIPITATGFRDADMLVLCTLSYFDLSPVFTDKGGPAFVRDCRKMIDEGNVRVEIAGKDRGYLDILQAAACSERFGNLRMTDYVSVLQEDPPLQFSAVTFHLDSGLSIIAFRGTDDSLAGWREDFMIGFSHTKAQEYAKEYAGSVIAPERRWMMGGHSKGGNLALYAACMMDEEKTDSLDRIFLLDSPGLCPEVVDLNCMERVQEKTTQIVPVFSVIGKLFEPRISDTRIVRSSQNGFSQHNLVSWGIDHGNLALAEENDAVSMWINQVLDKWIMNISREERVVFVNEVFDALSAGGAKTLDDLSVMGWEGFTLIKTRLQHASETTKRILNDLPRQAILSGLPNLQHKK